MKKGVGYSAETEAIRLFESLHICCMVSGIETEIQISAALSSIKPVPKRLEESSPLFILSNIKTAVTASLVTPSASEAKPGDTVARCMDGGVGTPLKSHHNPYCLEM